MFTIATSEGKVSDLISQVKIQHHLNHAECDPKNAAYHAQEQTQQYNRKTDQTSDKPAQQRAISCTVAAKAFVALSIRRIGAEKKLRRL